MAKTDRDIRESTDTSTVTVPEPLITNFDEAKPSDQLTDYDELDDTYESDKPGFLARVGNKLRYSRPVQAAIGTVAVLGVTGLIVLGVSGDSDEESDAEPVGQRDGTAQPQPEPPAEVPADSVEPVEPAAEGLAGDINEAYSNLNLAFKTGDVNYLDRVYYGDPAAGITGKDSEGGKIMAQNVQDAVNYRLQVVDPGYDKVYEPEVLLIDETNPEEPRVLVKHTLHEKGDLLDVDNTYVEYYVYVLAKNGDHALINYADDLTPAEAEAMQADPARLTNLPLSALLPA